MMGRMWRAMLLAGSLKMWAMFGAGIALTAFNCWLVYILWLGGWPVTTVSQRIWYLGVTLLIAQSLIGVIVVALASVKARGTGPGGIGFEVDGHDGAPSPPAPAVRTTTITETKS